MCDIFYNDTLAARNDLFEIMDNLDGVVCESAIEKINKLISETDGLLDEYVNKGIEIEDLTEYKDDKNAEVEDLINEIKRLNDELEDA